MEAVISKMLPKEIPSASDAERVTDIRIAYEVMNESLREEYVEMRELGDYVIGRQWTNSDESYLKNLGRVVRTFNMILPQIIAIEGTELNAKTKLRVYPREQSDTEMANIHTEVLQQQLYEALATDHLKRIASDAVIFRRGWGFVGWQYNGRYPDGQLVFKRINPFDIVFDVDNTDTDINKANKLIFTRYYTADRIIQLYAYSKPELKEYIDKRAMQLEGEFARKRRMRSNITKYRETSGAQFTVDKRSGVGSDDYSETGYSATNYFDPQRGLYRVIEYHERRYADKTFIIDRRYGKTLTLPDHVAKDRGAISHVLSSLGLGQDSVVERTVPEIWVTTAAPGLLEDTLLEQRPYAVQNQQDDLGFAYKCFPCYDFHPYKNKWVGVVDVLRDPQDAINRRMSSKDDVITRFLNPDIIGNIKAFGRFLKDWKSRKIGAIRPYEGLNAPKMQYPPSGIAGLLDSDTDMLMNFAWKATGVTPNLQGSKETDESGVLFENRVRQAETMLKTIIDNVRSGFLEMGRFAHATIQKKMYAARWIRILGPDGEAKYMQVNSYNPLSQRIEKDIREGFGKYDAVIDEAAYSRTEQERYYKQMIAMTEQVGDPMLKYLMMIDILPLSGYNKSEKLVEAIKKFLLLTYGPQVLASLEELQGAMQGGGNPNMLDAGSDQMPPGLPPGGGMPGAEGGPGGGPGAMNPQTLAAIAATLQGAGQ